MRIGIYNRYLTGVGGGEKYILAMAEILSQHYPVDVLTRRVVDLVTVGRNMGLDLSRVRLRALDDRPDPELAPITAEYDLLINGSDGTFVSSLARRSLLLVYFPMPIDRSLWVRFKWHAGHWLRQVLLVPEYQAGFYSPENMANRTVRHTRRQATLGVPVPPGTDVLRLRLALKALQPGTPVSFWVDDRPLQRVVLPTADFAWVDLTVDQLDGSPLELELHAGGDGPYDAVPDVGVVLADVIIDHPRHRLYRQLFETWFKEFGQRLQALYPTLSLDHLDTYDQICAVSEFSQRWIARYWGRPSMVLYPPVDVDALGPLPKKSQILSVGRFFTVGHNKKHLVMIRTFRRMVDDGLRDWELHLAGGTSVGPINAAYLDRVRREAAGYPIHIHADIGFEALRRLYGESALYWHATGYGENPERHPLRFEHFGLTTVEAMAAGCVPIVINGGGQPEIVTHGVDGFLWQSLDGLWQYTLKLIGDESLRRRMGIAARERSRAFGRAAFEERLWEIVSRLQFNDVKRTIASRNFLRRSM